MAANPENEVIKTYDVVRAVLSSKHTVLWPPHSWDVSDSRDGKGLDQAAAWVTGFIDEVNSVRNMTMESSEGMEVAAKRYRDMMEGY